MKTRSNRTQKSSTAVSKALRPISPDITDLPVYNYQEQRLKPKTKTLGPVPEPQSKVQGDQRPRTSTNTRSKRDRTPDTPKNEDRVIEGDVRPVAQGSGRTVLQIIGDDDTELLEMAWNDPMHIVMRDSPDWDWELDLQLPPAPESSFNV